MIAPLAQLLAAVLVAAPVQEPQAGLWEASIQGPGGPIEFGLELSKGDSGAWQAWMRNAEERIPVGQVGLKEGELRLDLWPYESSITASVSKDGKGLAGTWTRSRGSAEPTSMAFQAVLPKAPTAPRSGLAPMLAKRWRVDFSSSDEPSIAILEQSGREVSGTILTTVGDYRYLSGHLNGGTLVLCVFDGAHAFRFQAELQADGSLKGDFWSRDTWHEIFTAVPDDKIEMPDAYGLSSWTGKLPLSELVFPDVTGKPMALDHEDYAGKARLIVLFGTWCPNCYDETRYLNELQERYGPRGLSILGLAFEFDDVFPAQAAAVQRYVNRMQVKYPVLIAGPNDKRKATEAFPVLDKVRAYPTTLFMDAQGQVQAIHTGFSGPATGARHTRLREDFERRIEGLLGPLKSPK